MAVTLILIQILLKIKYINNIRANVHCDYLKPSSINNLSNYVIIIKCGIIRKILSFILGKVNINYVIIEK